MVQVLVKVVGPGPDKLLVTMLQHSCCLLSLDCLPEDLLSYIETVDKKSDVKR